MGSPTSPTSNGNAHGILRPRPVKPVNPDLLRVHSNGSLNLHTEDTLENTNSRSALQMLEQ